MTVLNTVMKVTELPSVPASNVSYLIKHPDDVLSWAIKDTQKGGVATARRSVRLQGPRWMLRGDTQTYQIQDYDVQKTYDVSVSAGSVVRVDDIIEVTAPLTGDKVQLYVNQERSQILIDAVKILTPTIESPSDRDWQVMLPVSITVSAYQTLGASDPVSETDVRYRPAGELLYQTATYAGGTGSLELPELQAGVRYGVQVRYRSVGGRVSNWSREVYFTTRYEPIGTLEVGKLVKGDASSLASFGSDIQVDATGTYMLISAPGQTGTGVVQAYEKILESWTASGPLTPSYYSAGSRFGHCVRMSKDGQLAIVGAPYETNQHLEGGAAYLFVRTGSSWAQLVRLLPNEGVMGQHFGASIAVSDDGTLAMVSAPDADSQAGAVYVYAKVSGIWTEVQKIVSDRASTTGRFGQEIALSGDGSVLAVTLTTSTPSAMNVVELYQNNGEHWVRYQTLADSGGVLTDLFGKSLAISETGGVLMIGAPGYNGTGKVSVYVETDEGWVLDQALVDGRVVAGDAFGYRVKMSRSGLHAIIGAPETNNGQGVAYLYRIEYTNWHSVVQLLGSDTSAGSYFGESVGLQESGQMILVGAGRNVPGSVYLFA